MKRKTFTLPLLLGLAASPALAADQYLVRVPANVNLSAPPPPSAPLAVSLGATPLHQAIVGESYTFDFTSLLSISGGAGSGYNLGEVAWSLDSGTLPAGLTLNTNGTIGGTPTEAKTSDFTLRATYKTASGVQAYQLVSAQIVVTLQSATLPAAMVDTDYAPYDFKSRLTVTGDPAYAVENVSFSATGLPQGMTLSSVGVLSGKPTAKNEVGASFEIQASYKGANGGQVYTIVVGDATLSVSQIGAGYYHTCAITTDEKVKCWGRNDFGQLGNEATTNSNLPVDVRNLPGRAVSIDVGGVHACALMETKELYCWGGNGSGQLGDGTTNNRSKPVRAGTLSNIVQFAAGENHTCAVTGLGAAHCWGNNAVGQIGTGLSGANRVTPYAVGGLSSGVRMIAAGAQNSCVVMTDGTAKCWGAGIANASLDSYLKAAPSDVKLANNTKLTSVKKIDIGHSHVCAVLTSGSAKCWGNTSEYPIGNATFGQFSPALYAADVIGLPEAIDDIDVGFTHSCAKTVSGKMLCWGSNRNGQLGRTISGSATAAPGYVAELNEVVIAISAGRDQTCATLDNGKVMCWGANGNGQVGDGSFTQRNRPVNVKP